MVAELGYSRPARLDRVSLFVSITGDSAIAVVLLTDVGSMLITQTQALDAGLTFCCEMTMHACHRPPPPNSCAAASENHRTRPRQARRVSAPASDARLGQVPPPPTARALRPGRRHRMLRCYCKFLYFRYLLNSVDCVYLNDFSELSLMRRSDSYNCKPANG